MNINRHNYEEFFILYMDNELESDDRRMVEEFVLQHPDLKEELDILLQHKMMPDTNIMFPGKAELMKENGSTPVSLTNYEEWLVLYTDKELTADQRKGIEQFIANNPFVQEELALLQRTKLQPEPIVFTHKESLYRKEEKVKALPVRWWRAVAAILILALGLTTFFLLNNKPPAVENNIVTTTPGLKDNINPDNSTGKVIKENIVVLPKETNNTTNQTAVVDNQKISPAIKQENKSIAVKNNKAAVKDKLPVNVPSPVKKEEQGIANNDNNKPSNNLPQPINNPNINKNNTINDAYAGNDPTKEIINSQKSLTPAPVTNVIPASYTNSDGSQLEEGGKNKKNRGFLRKLARTFEKRTNMTAADDDKLLIGGLAFKLK